MQKIYLDKNVFDATIERIKYVFDEFDNVVVSFSGGKDSGVLLNLVYVYAKEIGALNKVSMFHMDYECQYSMTTSYVEKCFLEDFPEIQKYWLCLPICAQCAVNITDSYWTPWEITQKNIWAREMPDNKFVINELNVPFEFKLGTLDYDVTLDFCKWFASKNGKTAVMIGIRTDESLNRYRAITGNNKVNIYKNNNYIVGEGDLYNVYPIYDWSVNDIWIANAKFGFDYNKLYDLYYQAGLTVHQMRVASPFNDCAIDSLKIYKIIEPDMWSKLVGRVNGVNFAGIYGGSTAMGWKSITLPKNHTWKSYLEFLLNTLPNETKQSYIDKFKTSIKFWKEKGGVLDDITIRELNECGIPINCETKSNYNTTKIPVRFEEYPDDADVTNFKDVPSYKRMCVCIMKNDHLCKYMGFAPTKKEQALRKNTIDKYRLLNEDKNV